MEVSSNMGTNTISRPFLWELLLFTILGGFPFSAQGEIRVKTFIVFNWAYFYFLHGDTMIKSEEV